MNNPIIEELRAFVIENFLFGQSDVPLSDDTSFLANGIIDSTGLLELISFMERHYDIKLADDELIPDNLDSLDRLARFVFRKIKPAVDLKPAVGVPTL